MLKRNIVHLCAALIITSIIQLPNYFAKVSTPPGYFYSGLNYPFNNEDINVYTSVIHLAQFNGMRFENYYVSTSTPSPAIYPLYTTAGFLFRKTDPVLIYNLLVTCTLFALAIFLLKKAEDFFDSAYKRVLFTTLVIFGGGLGLAIPNFQSADLYSPVSFLTSISKPHENIALIFYIYSFLLLFRGIERDDKRQIFKSAALFNIVTIFYPYHLVNYYAAALLYYLNKYRKIGSKLLKTAAYVLIITLPFAAFNSLRILGSRDLSNIIEPNFNHFTAFQYLTGYFFILPALAAALLIRKKRPVVVFSFIWIFSSLLISLIPSGISKYFLRGIYFPASLIFCYVLFDLGSKLKNVIFETLFYGVSVLLPASYGIVVILYTLTLTANPGKVKYYFDVSYLSAFEYLNSHSSPGEGVLCSYKVCGIVPVYSKNKVYFGHKYQTSNGFTKYRTVQLYYSGYITGPDARKFFEDNKIKYVLYGPDEKELGTNKKPGFDFTREIKLNGNTTLYEVI